MGAYVALLVFPMSSVSAAPPIHDIRSQRVFDSAEHVIASVPQVIVLEDEDGSGLGEDPDGRLVAEAGLERSCAAEERTG